MKPDKLADWTPDELKQSYDAVKAQINDLLIDRDNSTDGPARLIIADKLDTAHFTIGQLAQEIARRGRVT